MAKITDLTAAAFSDLDDADLVPIVDGVGGSPETKKATVGSLASRIGGPWAGKVMGCMNDGDPGLQMLLCQTTGSAAATPTNIGTSTARCSLFIPRADLVVNNIRWYGIGATTSVYRVALYRYSDLARLTSELAITTAAGTWGAAAVAGGVTLSRGVSYFVAVAVNATGTTAGIMCHGAALAAGTGANVAPQSLPGNLDIDSGFMNAFLFTGPVTSGALPSTFGTPAAWGALSGGMPAFWLDNA